MNELNLKDKIRKIIKMNDSLLEFNQHRFNKLMHCILPEHYNIMTKEIMEIIKKQNNEINWEGLQKEFYRECVNSGGYVQASTMDLPPDQVFDWFKKKIEAM